MRLAALVEAGSRFLPLLEGTVTDQERRSIATIRNIAAHAGYAAMDDDIFWRVAAVEVPELVERVLRGLAEPRDGRG